MNWKFWKKVNLIETLSEADLGILRERLQLSNEFLKTPLIVTPEPAPVTEILAYEPVDSLTPLQNAERECIMRYLLKNNWNQAVTSRQIGCRQNTLIVKMRKYEICVPNDLKRPGRKPKVLS